MGNHHRQCCVCGRIAFDGGYQYGSGVLCRNCRERGVAREVREMSGDLIKKEIGLAAAEGKPPRASPKKSGRCRECGESYKLLRLQDGLCVRCREAEEIIDDED